MLLSHTAATAADTEDQTTMATTTDASTHQDTPSDSEVGARRRSLRRVRVRHGWLTWAAVLIAVAAAIALVMVALSGHSDTSHPDSGLDHPPNYYPHGFDYGDAAETERQTPVEGQASTCGVGNDRLTDPSGDYPPNYYPHGFDYGDAAEVTTC